MYVFLYIYEMCQLVCVNGTVVPLHQKVKKPGCLNEIATSVALKLNSVMHGSERMMYNGSNSGGI